MAETQLRQNLIKACEQQLDPSKIVPLCDRLLHVNKTDVLGLRCKTIALLQSKRISQAAAVARELSNVTSSKKASAAGRFLLAMCMYRENKFAEAEDALTNSGKIDQSTFGAQELNLLAQSRYNQFQYREAAEIYERLLEEELYQDDLERDEILTNLSACYASVAEVDKCLATTRRAEEENHYDLLFNYATALSQRGRFHEASTVLADAERICIYSNDYQPDQIDFCKEPSKNVVDPSSDKKKYTAFIKDVVAIKVQQAFVAFNLNDRETAEKILNAVLTIHSSILLGTVAHAAACLNWTAIKRHSDFIDSYKRLKQVQQPTIAKRLTAEQRECAAYNSFLLALGVGKQAQARSMAEALIRDYPSGTLGPRALASVVASSDPKRAEAVLKKVFSSQQQQQTSTSAIHQTLTMAQLTLERGDALGALELAAQNTEAMSQPAVVTTVLAGYASLSTNNSNNKQQAAAAEKALNDLLSSKNVSQLLSSTPEFAFQVAFNVYARTGRHADAAALLEKTATSSAATKEDKQKFLAASVLQYIKARDVAAANRVAALPGSPIDLSKTSSAAKFTLAQTESTALPRDKLVKIGFAKPSASASASSGKQTQQQAGRVTATKDKPSRKRPKRRVPKTIDPAQKIDPERWIPWSMRTYVKDMPPRRRAEAKRRRADEQAEKRKAAEKRKKEASAAASSS